MKSLKTLQRILFFIALLIPFLSNAQSNYKPGYVVTPKGDTIRGFIDYREWDRTPADVNFKQDAADNEAKKYTPADIAGFGITGIESYRIYTGPISMDPTAPDKVKTESERDTSFRIATVFMKELEKGSKLALYSYKDDIKERFFAGDAPGFEPKELIFRVTRTTTENTFQKQLSALALMHNELNDNLIVYIGRSDYTESDILKIVNMINHVSKADYNKTHYSGPAMNSFIGAGVNINTTSPGHGSQAYLAGARAYTSYLPQGSLGINLFANPATKKLQFRIELGVADAKYKSLYTGKVSPYAPTEISYNNLALSGSVQVLYNFYNRDNFKVFAGGGVAFYSFSYSNVYFGSQNHDGSQALIAANNPFVFEKGDNAFIFRAGIQFTKNLVVTGSYQTPVSNTNGGYFELSSTTAQVGINYLFEFKRK
ncbi:outer membrane protein [Mucilaginibacter ginsenosidivorans]|uniref:Outer membrane beta-barrel protein n=1 Tax=Mucilaginibacter ginsenosidivorans TaxID=398053 RepID=A0A5B8UVK3_9SPHI|nr:hypothetical protein [Mucilaginibacter ginsenosidivorans]QEC62908.1 hypothetical protein FRZ54_10070 [Mucilaginibacter ginsenosidivorans]